MPFFSFSALKIVSLINFARFENSERGLVKTLLSPNDVKQPLSLSDFLLFLAPSKQLLEINFLKARTLPIMKISEGLIIFLEKLSQS